VGTRGRRRDGVGSLRRVCGVFALCACVCGVRGRAGLTVRGYAECPRSDTRHTLFYFFYFFKGSTRLAVGQHPNFAERFVEDTRQRATLPSVI